MGPEIEVEHGVRPQLRIGIHTGPVVVGEVGGDLSSEITALGDTVNLAARLESAADPDGVLMSEATHKLVEGYVESSFGGERALKGKSEPQRVWRLDRIKTAATRFSVALDAGLTGFVGRERELDSLESCWSAVRQGGVRLVNVVDLYGKSTFKPP